MKYLKEFNESNDDGIRKLCQKYGIEDYNINDDGTIDVSGNVYLFNKSLNKIPINFNIVTGDFICSYNKLESLHGCPNFVFGNFNCNSNGLTSLIGCPIYTGGDFDCCYNLIKSLENGPKEVQGDFMANGNSLTSLKYLPLINIGGYANLSDNPFTKEINDNKKYFKSILKYGEEYGIWKNDGSLDQFRFEEMMIDIKNED